MPKPVLKLPLPNLNSAKYVLKKAGVRATAQRGRILRALEGSKAPMSIYAIVRQLGHGGANQATVYRSLRALELAGIVRQVDLRHGHAHYELVSRGDHHHLVCWNCGRTEDFTGCSAKELMARALKRSRHFVEIDDHAIELFGTCVSCLKNEAKEE